MSDVPDWLLRSRSAVREAIDGVAPVPYRNTPRPRPLPRQMRPAEQRAYDRNAGVRRQAFAEIERRNAAAMDPRTAPRAPLTNQFAEAGQMALEGTGLPSVRRGARTLTEVARAPYQPDAPMRTLAGLGELGLGVAGAATIGEFGSVRPLPPKAPFARVGPSLADLADNGEEGLILGALRRRGANLNDDLFTQNMPVRNVPLDRIRTTDGAATEQQWVQHYTQNPNHDPIQVRRNTAGDYDLIDGHHRLAAARARGASDIEALDASGYFYPSEVSPAPDLEAPPRITRPPTEIAPNGMPIRPPQPFRQSFVGGSGDLADAARQRAPDVGNAGGGRVAYRGLNRPYDPNNGGYYQAFTSSLDDAREYGPNVMAANLQLGRNLAIDGGGNNFNALSVAQLPADVRARLHPSIGASATTDQIAHAAREAGYDSVTVRNVHDNRWGERPVRGAEPRTIDFVFDTRNISPLDSIPEQASAPRAPESRVRLSAADRALLDELERDLNAPARGDGQFSRAPGIAPQQAPPRTSPRLFPSPNTPRTRPQAPAGTGDMQPRGVFAGEMTKHQIRAMEDYAATLVQRRRKQNEISRINGDAELPPITYEEANQLAREAMDRGEIWYRGKPE